VSNPTKLTRRHFLELSAAVGIGAAVTGLPPRASAASLPAASLPTTASGARGAPARRPAVVSFHIDRTYVDATGMAEPYLPPSGTRSGQLLAQLSEVELRSRYAYF
jgi:hypothetical protein